MVNTGSCLAVRTWPHPTGSVMSGNQKSHCASSPAAYNVRDAGSGGRYIGRNSATRPLSVPRRAAGGGSFGEHPDLREPGGIATVV